MVSSFEDACSVQSFAPHLRASRAIKAVRFRYIPTALTRELLVTFREMVNDAIRICLEEDVTGRLRLRNRIYKEFQGRYGVVSCFPYSVAEVAWSIVKKHRRWGRKPVARRLMMKMDIQNYTLNHSILSLPFRKGERVLIPLQHGQYQDSFVTDTSIRRGQVTLTDSSLFIAFSKQTVPSIPRGKVGIDLNQRSAVDSNGVRYDLSEIVRLHTEYGIRRRNFFQRHHSDRRLLKAYSGSSREKERVRQIVHRTAKAIVSRAKASKQAIVLEKLAGVRRVHRRGSSEGRAARRRVFQWPFRILQSAILYKALWEGIQVEFVDAAYTSRLCHICRYVNSNLSPVDREWRCPNCGAILDRDFNAAINRERRGKIECLGEVRPGAHGRDEAVKGNPTTPVLLRAEVLKLTEQDANCLVSRTPIRNMDSQSEV